MGVVVHKFTLEYLDVFQLDLPLGAQPLHFGVQYDQPRLWVLLDPDHPRVATTFRLAGTGHPIGSPPAACKWSHVGTCMQEVGKATLIWHLFLAVPAAA